MIRAASQRLPWRWRITLPSNSRATSNASRSKKVSGSGRASGQGKLRMGSRDMGLSLGPWQS